MNPKIGLAVFVVITIAAALIRAVYLNYRFKHNTVARYKLNNSYGCYVGPGLYVISILFIGIGPLSFELVNLSLGAYIILNIIAGVGYGLTFPPLAPIANSGDVIIINSRGRSIAYIGKYMGRRFNVISMPTEDNPTLIGKRLSTRCEFEVISDH